MQTHIQIRMQDIQILSVVLSYAMWESPLTRHIEATLQCDIAINQRVHTRDNLTLGQEFSFRTGTEYV